MQLSIIIPVYNVSEFLTACLTPLEEIQREIETEIILINDGSSDQSLSIAQSFYAKLENFIIIDQKNSGVSYTRNQGLEIAKGKYLYFYDGDDVLIPRPFISFFKNTSLLNLDISCGNGYIFKDVQEKRIKKDEFRLKLGKTSGPNYYSQVIKNRESSPTVWLYLFKNSFLKEHNLMFLTGVSLHEDDLFIAKSFSVASSVQYFPEFFYLYRYREQSAINQYKHKFLDVRSTVSLVEILTHLSKLEKTSNTGSLKVINILKMRLLKDLLERYIYFKKHNHKELQKIWMDHYQNLPSLNLPIKFHIKIIKMWMKYYLNKIF